MLYPGFAFSAAALEPAPMQPAVAPTLLETVDTGQRNASWKNLQNRLVAEQASVPMMSFFVFVL